MQTGVSDNKDDDATLDITDLKHEGKLAICMTLLDYKIMICVYRDRENELHEENQFCFGCGTYYR